MYQGTRGAVSVALISLSVWGCSQDDAPQPRDPAPYRQLQALDAADAEAPDAAEPADAGTPPTEPPPTCEQHDQTCDGVDDDCDGKVDEEFQIRCVFGSVSVVCIDGLAVSQVCDDANVCTVDSCGAQGCRHVAISCDDGDVCTADSCDPQLGCESRPELGAACDDGNACTSGESCDAAGSCQPGAPLDVDDHNPCTADACDPEFGASHTALPGVACDDGSVCSEGDVCDAAGSCQPSASIALDDADPCTADACDPVLGVSHVVAPGAACDDGNACTQSDACTAAGSCLGLPPPDLDDADPCTDDSCDSATGSITHTQRPVGASCSDGNACNGAELCQGLGEVTVTVTAQQTFLSYDHIDFAEPPTMVRLSDTGFGPGRRIRLHTVGRYGAPNVSRAYGVFSSDTRLLAAFEQNRVPGAIQSTAPAIVTTKTAFDVLPTDIPQDFRTDDLGLEVTIPEGARYLMLGMFDSYYSDNGGSLQVVIRAQEPDCVGGEPPAVDDGNACTADACDASAGVTHTPVAVGTACTLAGGASGSCNASGVCAAN